MIKQLLDCWILPSDQSIFQSEETTVIHLINICSKVKHLCGELEILLLIEIQEGSAALSVGVINSHISFQEGFEHMVVALTQGVEYQGTHIVEGCHFIVVWLIGINT
jgi:hypothetical protein